MTVADTRARSAPPDRLRRPGWRAVVLTLVVAALVVHGQQAGASVSPAKLWDGVGRLATFLGDAFPPSLGRLEAVLRSLLTTFEMALVGTAIGVLLSVPLALAAARNTSPHPTLYLAARSLIGLFRTVPDIVWGLLFVVAVGLGPPAGVLALAVDSAGFCGRFFAERIEETDPELLDALRSTGAGQPAILAGAVLPTCLPSFVGTSMFALENSTRSSVVLGVVGAGGIGIELTTSMQLLRYDEAITVIFLIFATVMGVERISSAIRRKLI